MTGAESVLKEKKTWLPSGWAVTVLTAVLAVLLPLTVAYHAAAASADGFPQPAGSGPVGGTNGGDLIIPDGSPNASLRISELMASNKATLADGDGKFPDWVELYNMSDEPVQMEGWVLQCGNDSWAFPSCKLDAGEYLVIFCDGTDRPDATDGIYADFRISADGDPLKLFDPAGRRMDSFPAVRLEEDCSAFADEAGNVIVSIWPTPGFENTEAGYVEFQKTRKPREEAPVISEVMTANLDYVPLNGVCYDWIELYNPGSQSLRLDNYYISDREKDRARCRLPELTLDPGEYVLLYCDAGIPGQISFGLNAQKEEIFLSGPDGTLCDYTVLREIPPGCSFGRDRNGGFSFFASPSPGTENADGLRFTGEKPAFAGTDGCFPEGTSVLAKLSGKGTIRYTTDGSMPDESSAEYLGPFSVTSSCVVRAVSFQQDHLPSSALSLSFLIGEAHSLPVVSLACDEGQMFSEAVGLYSHPDLDLEISGAVMFYPPDSEGEKEEGFRIDCGIKLHGATSKHVQQKKSLKLNFRNRYAGALQYDLFGNGVTEYASILLRSGQEGKSSSYMRDALMHDVAMEAFPALPVQDHRYAALYINGRYWGLYNLREAHSEEHFAAHYGFLPETVTHWQGKWPKYSLIDEVYQYALSHKLSNQEDYEYVSAHIDIDSVIAWLILQDYSGNFDFNSPNMRFYWTEEDQKLRYALVDLDLGLFTAGSLPALTDHGYYAYNKLAGALMKNDGFRQTFLSKLNTALEGPLSDEAMLRRIDAFAEEMRPEIKREKARWGGRIADWEHLTDEIRNYVSKDDGQARKMVRLMIAHGAVKRAEAQEFLPAFAK